MIMKRKQEDQHCALQRAALEVLMLRLLGTKEQADTGVWNDDKVRSLFRNDKFNTEFNQKSKA